VGSTLLSWKSSLGVTRRRYRSHGLKDDRSSSADTLIYAWVGKVGVTSYQCSATATWTDYLGVWHFPNGSTLSLNDSTAASNTMTQTSYRQFVPPTAMAGKVDGAWGTTFVNEYRATAGTSTSAMGKRRLPHNLGHGYMFTPAQGMKQVCLMLGRPRIRTTTSRLTCLPMALLQVL